MLSVEIVGHAELPMDQQGRLLGRLLRIISAASEVKRSQTGDQFIGLPADGGMTLVFFGDPLAPARCATEIARALESYPEMKLRMGIHSGPVNRMRGIDDQISVAGEGIKIAQRITNAGEAGHILVSKPVADTLSRQGHWAKCLYDLGVHEISPGAPLQLFNLYTGEAGNPERPHGLSAPPSSPTAPAADRVITAVTPPALPDRETQSASSAPAVEKATLTPARPTGMTGGARRWAAIGAVALLVVLAIAVVLLKRPTSDGSQVAPPAASSSSGARPLKSYTFGLVTVDANGAPSERSHREAKYVSEDLGGGVTLDMVLIPAGDFLMGSPVLEKFRFGEEGPQHNVEVPALYIGKYEVTQAQWRVVAGFPKVKVDLNPSPSSFAGVDRPVQNVTWDEAVEFCDRLSQKTRLKWRLPSEAEWEYACRAGTTTPFYYGDTITPDLANYDGQSPPYGEGPKGESRKQTTPVGKVGYANDFGLFDMHGNVWEWVLDTWHVDYRDAPLDASAWQSDGDSSQRIARGGAWNRPANNCRSAFRLKMPRFKTYDVIGLRVAISASELPTQK